MKKIGLIGRIDPDRTLFDGQTVKTRMMHKMLCDMYGAENIVAVDTIDWRHRALRVAADTRRCLHECDDIVILLSQNGRRVLYPRLAKAARKRGKRIYQNLIGGWLDGDLEQFPEWTGYLNAFKINWVESHQLADALAKKGVTNASYLPNFKYLEKVDVPDTRSYDDGWRFCIFSRVVREKGVGDAMQAVEELNASDGGRSFALDIYGPIDEAYKEELDGLLDKSPHCSYKGSVTPEESVSTVSKYDLLLFPTRWVKEGIPGTIIDALSAGVPIIGAKWQYYDEMLEDGVTGFGYEFGHNELLGGAIGKFVSLSDEDHNAMRHKCLERAKAYTPEAVAEKICKEIGR